MYWRRIPRREIVRLYIVGAKLDIRGGADAALTQVVLNECRDHRRTLLESFEFPLYPLDQVAYASEGRVRYARENALGADEARELSVVRCVLRMRMRELFSSVLLTDGDDSGAEYANEAECHLADVDDCAGAILSRDGAEKDVDEAAGATQYHGGDDPGVR